MGTGKSKGTMFGNFDLGNALRLVGNTIPGSGPVNQNKMLDPTNQIILDSMIPGFTIIRQLFMNYFRLDITSIVTKIIFAAVVIHGSGAIWEAIKQFMFKYCFSSVSIPVSDRLNREVLLWMSTHVVEKGSRHLAAQSSKSDGECSSGSYRFSSLSRLRRYNPADFDERTPAVKYLPTLGTQWFWHRGRPFMFTKTNSSVYGADRANGAGEITLSCLGRNPEPLKRFLQDCKEFDKKGKEFLITVHTRGDYSQLWSEPILKPSRALNTVDMDDDVKKSLIDDLSDYLHPSSRQAYGRRGVPYRRGYLFYGPPGTGKTSMCLALAGHFKLELYTLSGYGVKDDELSKMFAALPPKCMILLEDIDSAGITRERMGETPSTTTTATTTTTSSKKRDAAARSGITLSGLLNAFDGTTSQEGRVLVMTSNTPETLDRALVRPGRIDRQVYFGPVSRRSAEAIFLRMFSSDSDVDKGKDGSAAAVQHPKWRSEPGVGEEELGALAVRFAELVPEGRVSPAELQGFLLDHKRPVEAVEMVQAWVREVLGAGEGSVEWARQKEEAKKSESDSSDDVDESSSDGS